MSCLLRFFQGLNTLSHYFLHNYQLFPLSWIIPSINSNSFHLKQNHQNSPCDSIFPCNSWLDLFTYLISLSIYLISVTAKLLKDLFKQVICISITSYLNSTLICPQNHRHRWWCSVTKSCLIPCGPWTESRQAFLSFTISWSLLKLMPIESVMPSNHLILCSPQSFPASGSKTCIIPTSQPMDVSELTTLVWSDSTSLSALSLSGGSSQCSGLGSVCL